MKVGKLGSRASVKTTFTRDAKRSRLDEPPPPDASSEPLPSGCFFVSSLASGGS